MTLGHLCFFSLTDTFRLVTNIDWWTNSLDICGFGRIYNDAFPLSKYGQNSFAALKLLCGASPPGDGGADAGAGGRGRSGCWTLSPGPKAGDRRKPRGRAAGPDGGRMRARTRAPRSCRRPRTRKEAPPRPADCKLQAVVIGSRGVRRTRRMERFADDTFCEACKSSVGVDLKLKTVELRGKKIRL